jgi:hypothetical protein
LDLQGEDQVDQVIQVSIQRFLGKELKNDPGVHGATDVLFCIFNQLIRINVIWNLRWNVCQQLNILKRDGLS